MTTMPATSAGLVSLMRHCMSEACRRDYERHTMALPAAEFFDGEAAEPEEEEEEEEDDDDDDDYDEKKPPQSRRRRRPLLKNDGLSMAKLNAKQTTVTATRLPAEEMQRPMRVTSKRSLETWMKTSWTILTCVPETRLNTGLRWPLAGGGSTIL